MKLGLHLGYWGSQPTDFMPLERYEEQVYNELKAAPTAASPTK